MKDSTHIIIDSKLTAKDIRDSLWRCRDFELSHFWQRSILLLTMIGLFATAYGNIVLLLCEEVSKYCSICVNDIVYVYNNIAAILCIVNIIFSVLWVMMTKGSKAWYERYEAAIEAFENDDLYINKELKLDTEIKSRSNYIGGFRYFNLKKYHNPIVINNIFSTAGGGYSPSRINILIGQIAIILWLCTFVFHLTLPFIMFETTKCILKYGILFTPIIIFLCLISIWLFSLIKNKDYFKIKSSILN